MRIAIVGAGFCGLAIAWHLLKEQPNLEIVIFDPNGIGGGASGIAAGLLHPFAGARAKLNRMGREGMEATQELLNEASMMLNQPVYTKSGILRIPSSSQQLLDFATCFEKFPDDVSWIESQVCQELIPGAIASSALFINDGVTVNCPLYLKGLWLACAKKGVRLETRKINNLSDLQTFDIRVIAAGPEMDSITELSYLPVQKVKGQVLELAWPKELPPLKYPINSHIYILMSSSLKSCYVGATFEKGHFTAGANIDVAKADLMPKAGSIIPLLRDAEILGCYAGVRAVTADYLPLVKEIVPSTWVMTGLGSKGLLYHALMAKKLVSSMNFSTTEKATL